MRFVDDFAFVMRNKEDILNTIPLLDNYLKEQLLLKLHPKKYIYSIILREFCL